MSRWILLSLRHQRAQPSRASGFTLIELAIAMAIIGLLLTTVLMATGLIGVSDAQAVRSAVSDLSAATSQFRAQYSYLPGDMPTATTVVPGVAANSCSATANGDGDGEVEAVEVPCVPWHLNKAGLIKGSGGAITYSLSGGAIVTLRVIARSASGVTTFPTSTRNVIELLNVPCPIAQDLDAKMDDGNFATGNVRASVASCTGSAIVASVAVAL